MLVVSAAVLAAACGRSEKKQTTGLSEDLRSDLALASSSLAYPDLKVIAPEEQAQRTAPKRASAPKQQTQARRAAPPVQVDPPSPTTETVEIAAAAPEASNEPEPAPTSSEPVIASPRPTPVAVQYPADGDDRGGRPRVVIRGGSAGEDHCEIHDGRRRSGIGILVNNRMPPMGVPTFPSGGIPINPLGRSTLPRIR
jgi:hypothetical protein